MKKKIYYGFLNNIICNRLDYEWRKNCKIGHKCFFFKSDNTICFGEIKDIDINDNLTLFCGGIEYRNIKECYFIENYPRLKL